MVYPITKSIAALSLIVSALPQPAQAQSPEAFDEWAARIGKTVHDCPVIAVPDVPPRRALSGEPIPRFRMPPVPENPWFGFNGDPTVAGFSCQQIGPLPYPFLTIGYWYMQNIKGG